MGKILPLNLKRVSRRVIDESAKIVKSGGVILYPTETIYGLGCNAYNEEAIVRIFSIKRRPETKPLLVLVNNFAMLKTLVEEIPPLAAKLMKHFWPGSLTLIFQACQDVSSLITAGSRKIGVRIPNNNFCLKLISGCRVPIVSTSANISGQRQNQNIGSLKDQFVDQVDLLLDAGTLPKSLSSTVVDISEFVLKIIREGAITKKMLFPFVKT